LAGAVTSKKLGDEADINPAQTQDQEIYNLLPVTDSEDLRRLRALYHYAVCPGDGNAFSLEWGLADRRYFQSAPTARASHTTSAAAKKPTLADVIRSDLTDPNNKDAKPADIANLIASKIAPSPTPEQVKSIKDIVASKDEDIDGKVADIIQAVGKEARLLKRYAAPTPGKAVAGKSDQTNGATPADSVAYEEYKKDVILSPLGLGSEPWLLVCGLIGLSICVKAFETIVSTRRPERPDERLRYLRSRSLHVLEEDNPSRRRQRDT
jgi:hypothetical protein